MSLAGNPTSRDPDRVVTVRDRSDHPIALEIRQDENTKVPYPIRCSICGECLDPLNGGNNLSNHLRTSDECREAIDQWLSERRDRRFSPGGESGAE